MPAIAVKGLTKSFGSHLALRGVEFRVEAGEAVVIFGPNGAGKTTLIKILATIMNPSSGEVIINGLTTRDNAEKIRRGIGVITHQTFLYSNLTAFENLDFYCRLYDVPRPRERIEEVAATVDMTSRLHDRIGTLSRGMQQRLSIARALLHGPSILLLDEPETGLDQQAVAILRQAVTVEKGGRRTVVLTTHNLERGLELSDRLLILARGKIVFEKTTRTLDLSGLKEAYHQYTG
ncbi:MAG: heme ABC exporter, ATP-binding protein CcmA [Chloroflexi bacterium RBG_16_56_11]|nr:MAG: heme ABC exporter, ATP-binding protein CcmA [Chloroflexi bacterium RBG_16_56_11]